jgi:hypothetical protein
MTATKAAHEDEGEEGNCEGDADRDYNARGDARGGGDGWWSHTVHRMVAVRRVRMVRMWIVAVRIVAERRVAVHGIVWMVAVRCVRMVRMWIVAVHGIVRVRRVAVHGIVRMVAVRRVAVRPCAESGRAESGLAWENADGGSARCCRRVRGGQVRSRRARRRQVRRRRQRPWRPAQVFPPCRSDEEEQNKSEHRAARCVCAYVCGRHSYLREVLLGRKRGSRC